MISRSGVVISITNCYIRVYFTLQEIAPYTGFGTLEDSKQSCDTLIPQPPKKDFIKMLENDGLVLRYEAIMVSVICLQVH